MVFDGSLVSKMQFSCLKIALNHNEEEEIFSRMSSVGIWFLAN